MTKTFVLALTALAITAAASTAMAQTKCKAGESLVNGKCTAAVRGS